MKEIDALQFPDNLRYSDDHEWVRAEGENVRIASVTMRKTSWAISFMSICPVWEIVSRKGLNSARWNRSRRFSEIYLPVGGTVAAVNNALTNHPVWSMTPLMMGAGWSILCPTVPTISTF